MRIFRGAIILATLLLTGISAGAQMRIRSELPNQKINDFYQDGERFVWISTDYGICRYNGSEYVNYFHSSSDSTSLLSNKVLCAREDSQNRLWVLTDEGVCRLDTRSGSFTEVLGSRDLCGMLCLPGRMLCYGRSGFVSISTENGSVSMHAAADKEGIVQAALQKDSLIWAVSGKDASVSCYTLDFQRIAKLEKDQSGEVNCLAADGDILWLGTAKGLRLYDTATQRLISAAPDYTWLETLGDFSISFIYPYGDNVCICTYGADVFIWHKQRAWLQKSLARRHIVNLSYTSDFSSALCTSDGQLWIGTSDRGYAVYNASEIEFCRGVTLKRITKGKYYNSMTVAPDSIIWMASRYKGLMSVNPARALHRWYRFIDDTDLKKLGNSGLSTVFCDSSGMLWLNMDENLGVAPVHGLEFGHVKVLGQKLISNAICQDARGDVWIAAEDGLYRFHDYRMEGRFFYGTTISDVCLGPDGKLYCCLSGVGVRTIDPEVVADPQTGKLWLFFGSTGRIHRVELNASGTALAQGATFTPVAGLDVSQNSSRSKVYEGAYLHWHDGYWYLFASAGLYSNYTYKIVVGRSASLTGTFVDRNGAPMLEGNATVVMSSASGDVLYGPGHNAEIFTDRRGQDYIFYHCHCSTLSSSGDDRYGCLQRIYWDADGWPYVTGAKPARTDLVPLF